MTDSLDLSSCEMIDGGRPTFPPTVSAGMFGNDQPLMHAAGVLVAAAPDHGGVVIALAHPQFEAGFYMGVTPDQARAIAGWLTAAANDLDSGKGLQ